MMEQPKHWLVGPHFDLFGDRKQEIAARGLRDGVLPETDLRALCSAVLTHAERHRLVLEKSARSKH